MVSSDLDLLSHSHVQCDQFIGPASTNKDASYSTAESVLNALQFLFYIVLLVVTLHPYPCLTFSFLVLSFVKFILIFLSHFLTVSPQPPVILGLEREEVKAGRTLVLRCVSQGGNPLATLHWTKVNLRRHLLRKLRDTHTVTLARRGIFV